MKTKNILSTILVFGVAIGGLFPIKKAFSETRQICAYRSTPIGFVVTSVYSDVSLCGFTNSGALSITNASILPPGTSLTVCSTSSIPEGYVTTSVFSDSSRCGRLSVLTIYRAEGVPIGTYVNVCEYSPIPPGFVVVSSSFIGTQCGSLSNQGITIRRTS